MTPDLQQEFQSLSATAKQALKDVAASGSYRHLFSLWIMPSFSPCRRVTVYSPSRAAKDRRPFVSFIIWRSDLDMEKLRSPLERLKYPKDLTPTIETDTLWLSEVELEGIQHRIRSVSIPIFLGHVPVAGCDGTSWEFRYDDFMFGASLHWWSNQPPEWRPFIDTVLHIAEELEQRRKTQGRPNAS
jgi:hypothetical protein